MRRLDICVTGKPSLLLGGIFTVQPEDIFFSNIFYVNKIFIIYYLPGFMLLTAVRK